MHSSKNFLAVSIPLHESLECAVDQAKNWSVFAPEANIVFHVSAGADFTSSELERALQGVNAKAFVNTESLNTGWADGSIIKVHLSNFKYASEHISPTIFAIDASNTLLVRSGLVEYLKSKYVSGCAGYNLAKPTVAAASANAMHVDEPFIRTILSHERNMSDFGVVPCEGVWFDSIEFKKISDLIESEQWSGEYATEEVYFAAALNIVSPSSNRVCGNYIMSPFEANLYVTIDDINAIHYGYHRNQDLFGVKRVPRNINHHLRELVRTLGGILRYH
jgi:hypothetical protein